MEITVSAIAPDQWTGDGLALMVHGLAKDSKATFALPPDLANLDQAVLGGTLQELISEAEFKGETGSSVGGRVGGNSPIRKVLLVGLGAPDQANLDTWRKAGAQAIRWGNQSKCKSLALAFPLYQNDAPTTVQAIAEGILLASHQDKRFRSEKSKNGKNHEPTIEKLQFLGTDVDPQVIDRARTIVSGVILARELVSAPANVVTPAKLAETAQELAQHSPYLKAEILEKADCEQLGMGAFLGVAQASALPPKFIHLTYTDGTGNPPQHKLAIVGKGLTFDSGGLNLKTGAGSSIELMKMDMAGAAAVLGCAKVIGELRPQGVEVHFLIAACENMISGTALHPGDIVTASNGKTIEVNNTDAEGRLTLADALVFADRLEVDGIVDLATLTGACIVALGDSIAGLWATDDSLAKTIEQSAQLAGEKIWRMPLEESYFEQMKSIVADMKNTGSRSGGAITGALFLQKFVEKTKAWAHLDIAGPVWTEKESGYNNPGGTGFPVRTLVNLILGTSSGHS